MLAELAADTLHQLFGSSAAVAGGDGIPEAEFPAFLRELETVRRNGFAANFEGTEDGISAIGMALHNRSGAVVGALTVAIPVGRFHKLLDGGLVPITVEACRQLELDIAANPVEDAG